MTTPERIATAFTVYIPLIVLLPIVAGSWFALISRIEKLEAADIGKLRYSVAILQERFDKLSANHEILHKWAHRATDDINKFAGLLKNRTTILETAKSEHDDRIAGLERTIDEWDRREVQVMPMLGAIDAGIGNFEICTSARTVQQPCRVDWGSNPDSFHPAELPDASAADRETAITAWIKRWGREPRQSNGVDQMFRWWNATIVPDEQFRDGDELPVAVFVKLSGWPSEVAAEKWYSSEVAALADLRQALGQLIDAGIPLPDCT